MKAYPQSAAILQANRRYIPGGAVSLNRLSDPDIVFTRAHGAYMWDAEGNQYIDYHAAFAPHVLGHNDPFVNAEVERTLKDGSSLFGSGTTKLEGDLARLICRCVPGVDSVQLLNSGSEATYQAMRVARAATDRDHVIVMQGGYNGWHNDVACNLMTPLSALGPRVSPGEYPFFSLSAGIPEPHRKLVHPVNFNDLESVRWVCERYPIACLITEPILQNIGIIHPKPGYLIGLRRLADEYGFVLIFDEIKTGFRHGLGGYSGIAGVTPDLVTFGKALANGYPIAAVAGRARYMNLFADPSTTRRVLLAGTYNGHPVPTAAAIATIARVTMDSCAVYRYMDALGGMLQTGVEHLIRRYGMTAVFARQGSAFCLYFMDHVPVDWHDLAETHCVVADEIMRRQLIERGIYFFPIATKQGSISAAHTETDIQCTIEAFETVFKTPQFQAALATSTRAGAA